RLRRSAAVREAVRDLIARHIRFATLRRMRLAKLRRWLQEPLFPLHLELHRLDCLASHGQLENYRFGLEAWQAEQVRPSEPQPLITGKDLLALGYAPGPLIGRILRAVEDARLEGDLTSREEAIRWVIAHYQEPPPPAAEKGEDSERA
ncbi:MAG: CCA tRNA nucleotidyltransferase, partial [Planctomycetota bacterium]|nr:CCA tRNA nucleotidyltransferase [Planctomycetota bacterium]